MNLHEYQAKTLLKRYGLPVQHGILAKTVEEAGQAFDELGSDKAVVIKAQVHTGGRGKAGGVKIAKNREEAKEIAQHMLGQRLITYQTDAKGLPINANFTFFWGDDTRTVWTNQTSRPSGFNITFCL